MKKTSDNFYDTPKWRRLRASIMRRDKYLDQEKKRTGTLKQAEIVHHIWPREKFPEYEYEAWNLIALAGSTHNEMHDRTTDELTEKGIALLIRTARKHNKPIPEEYLKPKKKKKNNTNWRR